MRTLLAFALLIGGVSNASAACACCAAPASTGTSPAATAGHPLKGVIVGIFPDKSALLVTHDEIPGVMSAMTMLLKVDAPTLAAAKKDQAINATLIKKTDGWWLENVSPVAAP